MLGIVTNRESGGLNQEQYEEIMKKIDELSNANEQRKQEIDTIKNNYLTKEARVEGIRENLYDAGQEFQVGTTSGLTINQDITLNDDITNYKYLEIQTDIKRKSGGFCNNVTQIIAVNQIMFYNVDTIDYESGSVFTLQNDWGQQHVYLNVWFKNNKTLRIGVGSSTSNTSYTHLRLKNIYGIK